jgi:shikimate dehydrogenase
MNRYGLIGYPLGHSFSSKYFTEKFSTEGISDSIYQLFPIKNIELLHGLLEQYPDLKGLNVTIPYKKDILNFLDDRSNLPVGLAACNCVKIKNGQLSGYNTDVAGFSLSLFPLLKSHHKKAMILGNGGATAAVQQALSDLGIEFTIVSRRGTGNNIIGYNALTEDVMQTHTVIVNTTPLGTHPHTELFPLIPYEFIGPQHLLFDLVYNPAVTTFMSKGMAKGAVVKNGYEMLVIQAEESWKIWQSSGNE